MKPPLVTIAKSKLELLAAIQHHLWLGNRDNLWRKQRDVIGRRWFPNGTVHVLLIQGGRIISREFGAGRIRPN